MLGEAILESFQTLRLCVLSEAGVRLMTWPPSTADFCKSLSLTLRNS